MVPAVRPSTCDIAYPFGTKMPPRCKLIYLQGWLPGWGGRQDIGDDQRCLGQAPGALTQEGRHVVRRRDQRVRQLRITSPCLSSHCLHSLCPNECQAYSCTTAVLPTADPAAFFISALTISASLSRIKSACNQWQPTTMPAQI